MSSWVPAAVGILAIVIIGVIIPLTVGSFVDIDAIPIGNDTTIINQSLDLVNNGFPVYIHFLDLEFNASLFVVNTTIDINTSFNPFEYPINATGFFDQMLRSFVLIPNYVLIPLLVLILFGISYTIFAFFRGI